MAELPLESIRHAIAEQNAAWEVRESQMTELLPDQQARRLGVIRDDKNLAELRKRAEPNLSRLIVESAVARLSDKVRVDPAGLEKDVASLIDFRRVAARLKHYGPVFPCWCWLKEVDWRDRCGIHGVTPIRDQAGCGSCVSFGSTATVESMVIIEHDIRTDLSEAELLFCGGGSCGGWWPTGAVTYIKNSGVSHEECFPYHDHNMPCHTCCRRDAEAITIRSDAVLFDVDQRKDYLFWVGPMIAVFAVFYDFFGYGNGVYSHVTGNLAGYHCVEVIGYNDNESCWLCKNSWGPGWGDQGFFRIAYGQCEIDTSFPFWGVSGTRWFA